MLITDSASLNNWLGLNTSSDYWVVNDNPKFENARIISQKLGIIYLAKKPTIDVFHTHSYVIILLQNNKTQEKCMLEFFENHVRMTGDLGKSSRQLYQQSGLGFLYEKKRMSFDTTRPLAFAVDPTLGELRDLDILSMILRNDTPNPVCTEEKARRGEAPYYFPNFSELLK